MKDRKSNKADMNGTIYRNKTSWLQGSAALAQNLVEFLGKQFMSAG